MRRSKKGLGRSRPRSNPHLCGCVILDKQRFMSDELFGRSLLYVLLNSLSLASFLAVTHTDFPEYLRFRIPEKCLPSAVASETTISLLTEPEMCNERFVHGELLICRCGVYIISICNCATVRPPGSGVACVRAGGGE